MKTLFVIPLLLAVSSFACAQEVLSSASEEQKAAGIELNWTIGETVIETWAKPTNILTQGFHQTKITVTANSEIDWPGLEIKVFPNPVGEKLNIELSIIPEKMMFSIVDVLGKTIRQDHIKSDNTVLDFSQVAAGQYFLKIQTKTGKPVKTFKIMKGGIE